MNTYTLEQAQLDALKRFSEDNGRTWKSKLQQAWCYGNYREYCNGNDECCLQSVRNEFGPSWLVRFSFNKPSTHSITE